MTQPPSEAHRLTVEEASHLAVLYVEDNPDDQVLFQHAWEEAGLSHAWRVAGSAAEAIDYLTSLVTLARKHAISFPSLILVDRRLANGSGLDVIKFIRRTPEISNLPVVLLTGSASLDDKEELSAAGATDCLLKPCGFQKTVELVKELYSLAASLKQSHPARPRTGMSL